MISLVRPFSNETIPFIVQVGVGGTGSNVVQLVSQMLSITGKHHVYVLTDPDLIEEKNKGNQLFIDGEEGLPKAEVLAERYSQSFGLNLWSYTNHYIESVEALKSLFQVDYTNALEATSYYLPILVGCVDNNYSRKIMNQFFDNVPTCIYIDAGNESVEVPSDWQTRPIEQWNEAEKEAYYNSGYSGQVVVGVKIDNKVLQEPVVKMFPDILEDTDTIAPSELSCAELSASEPQRLITNKFAALSIANVIQEILFEKNITHHMTLFHAKKGYMRSIKKQECEDLLNGQI